MSVKILVVSEKPSRVHPDDATRRSRGSRYDRGRRQSYGAKSSILDYSRFIQSTEDILKTIRASFRTQVDLNEYERADLQIFYGSSAAASE